MSDHTSTAAQTIYIRRSNERGSTLLTWLNSQHTFSFGDYIDPEHMGFRDLRVINEDRVAGGAGFPEHEHRSVEIFTYVIDGALLHEDSLGNTSVIERGQFQYMNAGSGVRHSEMNHSESAPVHFLQIWLQCKERAEEPTYGMLDTGESVILDGLVLLASPEGQDGALKIKQDAEIHLGHLSAGGSYAIEQNTERPHFWVQVIRGNIEACCTQLKAGDGLACKSCGNLTITANEESEFLLFCLR